jgi:hypothetical protein
MWRAKILFIALALNLTTSLFLYSSNATLNNTGIEMCTNIFFNCTAMNNTYNNYLSCQIPFESCLSQNAYLVPSKPLDCFLAESGWTDLYDALGFSAGIFLFANIFWPAFLKGAAKTITKMSKSDPAVHPYMSSVGKFFMYFTDIDNDGVVTAAELISPQTIFTFASALLPITPWINANDQQARCNYAMTLPPS